MLRKYLSFRTTDSDEASSWAPTGKSIIRALGDSLAIKGFRVNFEVFKDEPDWGFAAYTNMEKFSVFLAIVNYRPCRWFIEMDDESFTSIESRESVFLALKSKLKEWPQITEFRWHSTHETLRELTSDTATRENRENRDGK